MLSSLHQRRLGRCRKSLLVCFHLLFCQVILLYAYVYNSTRCPLSKFLACSCAFWLECESFLYVLVLQYEFSYVSWRDGVPIANFYRQRTCFLSIATNYWLSVVGFGYQIFAGSRRLWWRRHISLDFRYTLEPQRCIRIWDLVTGGREWRGT